MKIVRLHDDIASRIAERCPLVAMVLGTLYFGAVVLVASALFVAPLALPALFVLVLP